MSIQLPGNTKKWAIANNGDLFGHIVRTKNMDFNKEGYASLARKAMALYSSDTDSNFGSRVVAITANGSLYYIVTSDHVYTLAPAYSSLTFAELGATGTSMVVGSDAVMFAGVINVSTTTKVESYAPSSWTDRITGLSASYVHPLCVFENRVELCVANGNVVTTYNTSWSLQNTLTLPAKFVVTTMRWRGNNLYIGTRTVDGSEAMMFIWNGTGTTAQQGYPVGSPFVYSLANYQGSIAALTSAGQCLRFNGGGFDVLFNLPVYYADYTWETAAYSGTAVGHCLNRGMVAIGDLLYLNIDDTGQIAVSEVNQPGGIWVYDPKVGAPYHKAGFQPEVYSNLTISTLASSIFTMASAHGCETGDAVWASSVSNIAALTAGQVYYAVKVSSTALKLALSPADAFAGRTITASGTLSGDKLAFDNINAVSNTQNITSGAVSDLAPVGLVNPFFGSELVFGGSSKDNDGNTISTFMSLGSGRNVGSFVTPYLPTAGFTDSFKKILSKLKELNLDTDKILIKYRLKDKFGLPTPTRYSASGKGTWVDTTSFTVLTTAHDVKAASVGDEVEIVEGAGAGYSAHITAIDDSTSTYTYTIDEAITAGLVGDLFDFYIDNWTKLGTITNATDTITDTFFEQTVGKSGAQVQFKFELRGFDVSVSALDFINGVHKERV